MKKLVLALLIALSLLGCAALAEDAVSSASVSDSFAQFALTGDDLMNAINTFSGTYVVTTVNPDGTPNAAYFSFSMVKHEGEYYLQLGLAPNQSKANLLANGAGLAVYAANPSEEEGAKDYTVSGARIWFATIEDQAVADQLTAGAARPGALFYEVVEVRPLG